jgi:hypothetical protein
MLNKVYEFKLDGKRLACLAFIMCLMLVLAYSTGESVGKAVAWSDAVERGRQREQDTMKASEPYRKNAEERMKKAFDATPIDRYTVPPVEKQKK